MKKIAVMLLVLLLATSVVALAQEPPVVRVTAQSWQVSRIFIEEAAAAFMKNHPGVTVSIEMYAEPSVISNYAINWMRGDTPVDIAVVSGAQFASQFIGRDLIHDFTQLGFFDDPDFDRDVFVEVALQNGMIRGDQFVIPLINEVFAVNVNVEMFREAGLGDENGNPLIPKDWHEFYEFAKKMHKVDANGKVIQQGACIQWGVNMYATVFSSLQGARGSIIAEDGFTVSFDNPEFREILEVWRKGVEEGVFTKETFADYQSGVNSYNAGNLAMLLQSGSHWLEAIQFLGRENVSVIPIPGGLENGSFGFGAGVIIPKSSPAPQLAIQFIKEGLLGDFSQSNTLNQFGKGSALKVHYDTADHPEWAKQKEIAARSVSAPPYRDFGKLMTDIQPIIQRYLNGSSTLDRAIQELEKMVADLDKTIG